MINPSVLEKFSKLPEQVQDAVSEYIEYLYDKYEGEAEIDIELTREGEALLQERLEELEKHPERLRRWEEVRREMHEKRGWK